MIATNRNLHTESPQWVEPRRQEIRRRFGSEADVETITGISKRTLQKDRLLGRDRFPWYRVRGKVLYDLDEVVATIRAGQRGTAA